MLLLDTNFNFVDFGIRLTQALANFVSNAFNLFLAYFPSYLMAFFSIIIIAAIGFRILNRE